MKEIIIRTTRLDNFKLGGLGFALILVLLTSGCVLDRWRGSGDDWRDDVLMASPCGMDGLPCCPNEDPPCRHGQVCCSDPNDPERNKCVDECDYGSENNYCRADEPKCDMGLACYQGDCALCGESEQSCCPGDAPCQGDLYCYEGKCLQCGLENNPCCLEAPACEATDSLDANRTQCFNGACRACGYNNKRACENEPFCNFGHLLNNNKCLQCGGFNEPCCRAEAQEGHQCGPGLTCELGFCS